jgi:putative DNA primase/helicase
LVELPDLPDKKGADVSDWLDAGHTKIELQQAVMDTAVYDLPPADDVEPVEVSKPAEQQERVEKIDLTRYEFSDLGNAERLLACYRDRIRFCSAIGWLMWDGKRWRAMMHSKKGDHLAVMQLAIKAIRTFKEQCVDIADPKRAAQAFKHALTSEGLFRLEAMVELAKGFVEIKMELLDQDAHLLNVANGTLDLRTGELRDHCKDDYLTRVIPVEYHSDTQAPTWIRFLDTVMAGNANLIGYLQRGAGYSLIGLLRDHVLFIPYGVGSNGKSTFLGTVANVLGEYAQGMAPETLMSKKYEGIPNDIARLKGTRFVSALETKRGRQLDESVVKKLTGGDTLTGRFLHKEFFDFEPTHKLWLATNHKPVIKDTTGSIWRRVNLIPFNVVIPDAEQDKALGETLRAEAPGVLAWAVEGCRQWMADGLRTPDEVRVATEQYRQEQDALSEFVALTIEVWPRGWVTIEDIGKAYEDWAFEYGGAEHQGEGKRSTRDITNYLVSTYALTRASKKVDGRAHKVLLGIRLRPPVTEVTDVPVIPTDPFPSRKTGNPVTTVTATPKADTSDPDDLPNSENF